MLVLRWLTTTSWLAVGASGIPSCGDVYPCDIWAWRCEVVHRRSHDSQTATLRLALLTPNLCSSPVLTAGMSNSTPSPSSRSQPGLHSHQQERDSSRSQASPREGAHISACIDALGLWSGPSNIAPQCSNSSGAGPKSCTQHRWHAGDPVHKALPQALDWGSDSPTAGGKETWLKWYCKLASQLRMTRQGSQVVTATEMTPCVKSMGALSSAGSIKASCMVQCKRNRLWL